MQRSALVIVMMAVLSAGTVAGADETPPREAAQTQATGAGQAPPPAGVVQPPTGQAPAPPGAAQLPGAAQPPAAQPPAAQAPAVQAPAVQAPAVQAPPAGAAESPHPPQGAVQAPASGNAGASPPAAAVQPPPAQSAVQSVAREDAEAILGQQVTDQDGKDIGRLVDVLVDVNGQPQAAVIDFGGFMGVGNRKIAVHWSALHFSPSDAKRKVTLEMTPDQIKAAPEFVNSSKAAPVVTPANAGAASP